METCCGEEFRGRVSKEGLGEERNSEEESYGAMTGDAAGGRATGARGAHSERAVVSRQIHPRRPRLGEHRAVRPRPLRVPLAALHPPLLVHHAHKLTDGRVHLPDGLCDRVKALRIGHADGVSAPCKNQGAQEV